MCLSTFDYINFHIKSKCSHSKYILKAFFSFLEYSYIFVGLLILKTNNSLINDVRKLISCEGQVLGHFETNFNYPLGHFNPYLLKLICFLIISRDIMYLQAYLIQINDVELDIDKCLFTVYKPDCTTQKICISEDI